MARTETLIAALLCGIIIAAIALSVRQIVSGAPAAKVVASFQCQECGHVVEVDLQQPPELSELAPPRATRDCPKCGAVKAAWEMVVCPQCGRGFVPPSAQTGGDPADDVCPHCGVRYLEVSALEANKLSKAQKRQRK